MFPAYAGMNRSVAGAGLVGTNVSRIRGDEPSFGHTNDFLFQCFPHTRG